MNESTGFSITSSFEARVTRKLRWRLLPFLFLLYVLAFLDRINIGFAALTMNKELAITSQQFGFAAGIFFLGYSTFEIPSNLLLHRLGARIWIARILIVWGVVATLSGWVRNVQELYFARFVLGLAEAGYFPGIVLYLTYWFRQRDQAKAIAIFMGALPVTSILGGPLSGLILDHVHWLGTSSWRWLFILQGMPAAFCGILTYFLLPGRPAEARFLTAREKEWVISELKREEEEKLRTRPSSVLRTLIDGRVWHMSCIQFFFATAMYSMSFWMPQVLKALGRSYSNTAIGGLVMIPYLVALIGMVLISHHSDRTLERRYHAAVPMLIAAVSLMLLGFARSPSSAVILFSIVALGLFGSLGPFWSLPSAFLTGYSAASGIALVNAIANLGGFAGPSMIGAVSKRTGSFYEGLAVAGLSVLIAATLLAFLPREARAAKENG